MLQLRGYFRELVRSNLTLFSEIKRLRGVSATFDDRQAIHRDEYLKVLAYPWDTAQRSVPGDD